MQLAIALAAEEAAGGQVLRRLARRGHRVVAVFSDSDPTDRTATVANVAGGMGIPVRGAGEVRDPALGTELAALGVDLLLNVHSLHIICPEVVASPGLGAYNLHPGPLPERAGLQAPSWALYEGDETHGVTLHQMTAGVDEGAIAFIERFQVGPRDTALGLMMQCVRRGLRLIDQLLDAAERGDPIPAHHQDLRLRRWFGAGPPQNGGLEWDRPAQSIVDFVRACDSPPFPSPWPFPRCAADDGEVAVAAAEATTMSSDAPPGTVASADGGAILIAAADVWVRVERLELGGSPSPAAQILSAGERLLPPNSARR